MFAKSKQHLKKSGKDYRTHFLFSFKWGFFLIWTGVASVLHAFVPSWFPFTAPRNVLKAAAVVPPTDRMEQDE